MENVVAFIVSIVTVIAIILTISIYIVNGATSYFYIGGVISIALGLFEAFLVSREGNYNNGSEAERHEIKKAPKRKPKMISKKRKNSRRP